MSTTSSSIIVALDFTDRQSLLSCIAQLDPSLCRLKVGKELFTQYGPELVRQLITQGYDIFLDLKFHDIPNTVAKSIKVAADLGVWMVDIHTSGGTQMMLAAKESLLEYGSSAPLLIGVTVLTSLDQQQLTQLNIQQPLQQQVLDLSGLAQQCGLDGVVCSAQEAALLQQHYGDHFLKVTPGIRPTNSAKDDQNRTMTPQAALNAGANYLVIGRPITQAPDPQAALIQILHSIQ